MIKQKLRRVFMNKTKLALIATIGVLFSSCGNKTEVDFSIVPIKGANGEYQYIDIAQKGKIVINPQFEQAHIFRDGLALVRTSGKDGKWGYIDKKGKFAIAPVYSKAQDFSEGVAWVQLENQPPMLIDKKSKMILQIDSLTEAYPFHGGIATVKTFANGQESYTFINKKGELATMSAGNESLIVINDTYTYPVVSDGIYAFGNADNKKFGYKSIKGDIIVNDQFDFAAPFFDGMAVVMSGNKYGVINKKGEYIINPQYEELYYDSDGLFSVNVGIKYGWINKKGEIVINPQFNKVLPFHGNKLAPIQMGDKWAYIDRQGQIIINPQFSMALPFHDGYAMVENNDKIGFINTKGEFAVHPMYDSDMNISFEYLFANRQNVLGFPVQFNGDSDNRDGKTYRAVKIGSQIWMAENLNYNANGSMCHNGESVNCEKYGRLYNWTTARKVCPAGWHLPSDEEWQTLVNFAGGSDAGKKLKAKKGWNSFTVGSYWSYYEQSGNGTDEYGFSALPGGGYSNGSFDNVGNDGSWWCATELDVSQAYRYSIYHKSNDVNKDIRNKTYLRSVRCIQGLIFPAQFNDLHQNGKFKSYDRLVEKKEEHWQMAITAASGSLTDSRDNKTYKTIKIGTQTWMAENLNYVDDGYLGLCYGDRPKEQIRNPENCEKYGRLYDWSEAMGLERAFNGKKFDSNAEKEQGVCPAGWHLPSVADWNELMMAVGGDDIAGKKLRAKNGWNNDANGTDDYGFAALPGGQYSNGKFSNIGTFGYWWSATENNAYRAQTTNMDINRDRLRWDNDSKASNLANVRCVKD